MKKRHRHNKIEKNLILLILLILTISILAITSSIKEIREKNNHSNEEIKKEKIPDDTIEIITRQIDLINTIPNSVYNENISIKDIDQKAKEYSVLYYLYNNKNYNDIDEETYNRLFINENKDIRSYKKINEQDIIRAYKELYNKVIEITDIELDSSICPHFMKDGDNYYLNISCLPKERITYYVYNYEKKNNNIIAHIALGIYKLNETYNYSLYSYSNQEDQINEPKITNNNYIVFAKYEIVLHKNKNNYYIRKIRKEETINEEYK